MGSITSREKYQAASAASASEASSPPATAPAAPYTPLVDPADGMPMVTVQPQGCRRLKPV